VGVGAVVVAVVAAMGVVVSPRPAGAHASTLNALTVDLLLDQSGLVVIDGATNANYQDAPSPDERVGDAQRIGDALGIPRDDIQLDPSSSTLYHEVGFRMSLRTPFTNALPAGTVQLDTGPLQRIAADFGRLVLDVCGIDVPGIQLDVSSSAPVSPPDPANAVVSPTIDRSYCHTWNLGVDDPPVQVTARAPVHGPTTPRATTKVVLPCGAPSSGDPTFIDAGAIARSSRTMQAHAIGPASAGLLEAETIVAFTTRSGVDLVVPEPTIGHLSFGSRALGARATRRLHVPNCKYDEARPWRVSGVTFWIDQPGCLPVIVKTPKSVRTVRFPVGAACESSPR
jgi:hypothetical protein